MNIYRRDRSTVIGFLLLLVGLLVVAGPVSRALAQSPSKTEAVLKVHQDAHETFLKLIENLSDEQWRFKTSKLRHTIGEEAEHVALAENDLQKVILRALDSEKDLATAEALAGKENKVRRLMLSPRRRAESFKPPNRLKSKAEVHEFYRRAHRGLLQGLESQPELEGYIYEHPNKKLQYGELTALQWYYYIAYHKLRHCEQIKDILAQPDFPGGARKTD
jgi:hypothetical protein